MTVMMMMMMCRIERVRREDRGDYICSADNRVGKAVSKEISLEV
jgi:hypothetical protein